MTAKRLAAILATLASLAAHAVASAPPYAVEWKVEAAGKSLERDLVVVLKDAAGRPVEGARVEVSVEMPSMPMMHRVPMAVARPAGPPGRYVARVELEMAGEWAAKVVVRSPRRHAFVRKFAID